MSAPRLIGVHHTRMISDIRWASVDTVFGAGAMDGGQLTTRAPRAFPTRHVEIAQIAAFPFSSMSAGAPASPSASKAPGAALMGLARSTGAGQAHPYRSAFPHAGRARRKGATPLSLEEEEPQM